MRFVKWIGMAVLGLIGILLVAAGGLFVLGGSRANATVAVTPESITPATDSAALDWGEHLARTHGCYDCHGERLAGTIFIDAPPFLVVAPNLTSGEGGVGSRYGAADWERAVRHGVGIEGRGLFVMPSDLYAHLADDELSALTAHLMAVAPVDNVQPATRLRPLGRVIAGAGGIVPVSHAIDQDRSHTAVAPAAAATLEYGEHRVRTMCTHCHGPNLEGAPPISPEAPPGPALYHVSAWTPEQFRILMRTGVTPAGRQIDPAVMPWTAFRHMYDEEIESLQLYIQLLPQTQGNQRGQ